MNLEKSTPANTKIFQTPDFNHLLSFIRDTLLGISLGLFLCSPLIQLLARMVRRTLMGLTESSDLTLYQNNIDASNQIITMTALVLYLAGIIYPLYKHKTNATDSGSICCQNPAAEPNTEKPVDQQHIHEKDSVIPTQSTFTGNTENTFTPEFSTISESNSAQAAQSLFSKQSLHRLSPFFLFVLFSIGILVSTLVRGASSDDLTGHWYMHESILSYATYALGYFFCGMLVWKDSLRRFLLYLLIGTAFPVHILTLANEMGTHIAYFDAQGLQTSGHTAVFFNSNHYGYYLAITLLIAALLAVYETHTASRIFSALCAVTASIVLIINNTLGAYLAVLITLILFLTYCLFANRAHWKHAVLLLFLYLLITLMVSFRYPTILSSFSVLSGDIGMILENPSQADSAGSSRWRLWKETILHLPEHPMIGFGVEGLLSLYGIGTPHSEPLQYAAFFGIPVMLLYLAACVMVLWRTFRSLNRMTHTTAICFFACIGYLTSSLVGVAIFYTTPFCYILLGMCYAEYFHASGSMVRTENASEQKIA